MKVLGALLVALLVAASTQSSQALPKTVSCNEASMKRLLVHVLEKNNVSYKKVNGYKGKMQCFIKINLNLCRPCRGNTACMEKRGREVGDKMLRSYPECAGVPRRRLRATRRLSPWGSGQSGRGPSNFDPSQGWWDEADQSVGRRLVKKKNRDVG